MAVYPPPTGPKFRNVRSATIVQQGRQVFNSTGKLPPTLSSSKPQFRSRQTRVTAEDLKDPQRLLKVINDLQAAIDQATAGARSNPLGTPCIVRGIATTNGTPVFIPHTLGRGWTGLWCINQSAGAPSFTWQNNPVAGYPNGLDPTMGAYITPTVTGTYDLAITGD